MEKVSGKSIEMGATQLKLAREAFVRASQEAMRHDDPNWVLIDGLMAITKRLDHLRNEVKALQDSPEPLKQKSVGRIDKSGYPKYVAREDGSVVRIGLSQNGSEYEHVAKEHDFRSIIEIINRFVHSEAFAVDDVQKSLNLPSYLTHLVISLLREKLDKLESPKRGRYVFKEKAPLNADAILNELRSRGD
jgi:hypothetical protein